MLEGSLRELGDCTVGLIGMGDIGKATARLLAAFGADVAYFKPRRLSAGEEAELDVRYMEREQLLASCDIVSLHLPVTEVTRYMVDDDFLRKMKDTAYLINTSRGELVDSASLVKALESGWIAGAGLDTMDGEAVQPVSYTHLDVYKRQAIVRRWGNYRDGRGPGGIPSEFR